MAKTARKSAKLAAKEFPPPPPDDAPLIDWALWHHDHGEINGYWLTPTTTAPTTWAINACSA